MVKGEEEMSIFKTGKVGANKDRVEKSGNLWTYELVPEDVVSLTSGEFVALSTLVGDKIELLEKDKKLREKLRENGLKTAQERDWNKIEDQIMKLYE